MRETMMTFLVATLFSLGCARPETYVRTDAPLDATLSFRSAGWVVAPPKRVLARGQYAKALLDHYKDVEAFKTEFANGFALPAGHAEPGHVFRLELPNLEIDERTEPRQDYTGPDAPDQPHRVDNNTYPLLRDGSQRGKPWGKPWCVVRLEFRVLDEQGRVVVAGSVQDEAAKEGVARPDETRLLAALGKVRSRLTEYLSGRMSPKHVASKES